MDQNRTRLHPIMGDLDRLKEIAPEVFQTDGTLDLDRLEAELERYGLRWRGRHRMINLASAPPRGRFEPGFPPGTDPLRSNLFIEGDNLEALKLLLQTHSGRIKAIYIDPPYNTGNLYAYSDRFGHDAWLSMIHPRLSVARRLLREDGAIFVSIDDNELANLLLVLAEIFGEDNFVCLFKWKRKRKPSFLSGQVATTLEYIALYAKNREALGRLSGGRIADDTRPVLNAGNRLSVRTLPAGAEARRPDGVLPPGDYGARTLRYTLLDEALIKNGRLQGPVRIRGPFRVSQETLERYGYITRNLGLRRYVAEEEKGGKMITDALLDVGTNEDAETELRRLFGTRGVLEYPKPVGLLRFLLGTVTGPGDIVLDFFAGSCSTAQAVVELNLQDGGERRYIVIEHPVPLRRPRTLPDGTVLEKLSDIGRERIDRFLKSIEPPVSSHDYLYLKVKP